MGNSIKGWVPEHFIKSFTNIDDFLKWFKDHEPSHSGNKADLTDLYYTCHDKPVAKGVK